MYALIWFLFGLLVIFCLFVFKSGAQKTLDTIIRSIFLRQLRNEATEQKLTVSLDIIAHLAVGRVN